MAGNGRPRRGADEGLAIALAAGSTVRDAAAGVGVAERTAFRRLADATFCQRVADLRAGMVDSAVGKVADGMTAAADALRGLLTAQSEAVRLGACKALLELGIKLRDAADHEDRLKRLENLAEWVKTPRGAA